MNRDRELRVSQSCDLNGQQEEKYWKQRFRRDSINGGFDMKTDRWSENGVGFASEPKQSATTQKWLAQKKDLKIPGVHSPSTPAS
eukprot:m.49249 g.49249  ORF g.49249 m.49249 type:complete len:85 (+) comp20978_c0_seq1:163-417(+)